MGEALGAGGLAADGGFVGLVGCLPSEDGDPDGFADVDEGAFGLGNSDVRTLGSDGLDWVECGAGDDVDRVAFGRCGSDSKGWGAMVLVAEGGRDGRDGVGRGRPGNVIDDDDELADIGSDGANAMKAGTPMSARPNVHAVREPTRRRTLVRGIFPKNLRFRLA